MSASQRNAIWDSLVDVLGYEPKTRTEKTLWGKCVTSLLSADATPDAVREVAVRYNREWPKMSLTVTSIEKWYSHMQREKVDLRKKPPPPCPECGVGAGFHASWCERA